MRHIQRHMRSLPRGLARAALLSSVCLGLLVACGGGDDGPAPAEPPATDVPASAGVSVAAFVNYLRGLASDDTREPLGTDAIEAAPTSETDEPLPLE